VSDAARRLPVCTAVLVLLAATASAGEIQDHLVTAHESTLVRPHALSIHNSAEQKITISVWADATKPVDITLKDGEVRELTDGSSNQYVVRIPTGRDGEVKYRLESQKRYQIYWNESRGLWDLVELEAGG